MTDHTVELVNMKRTPAERKIDTEYKESEFPWGLSLNIQDESVDKLGFDTLPPIGTEYRVMAIAVVTSVNESEHENAKKSRSIGLQITDLALEPAEDKSASEKMFGKA